MYRYLREAALVSVIGLGTFFPGALQAKDKAVCGDGQNSAKSIQNSEDRITRDVRHELVMLPYYGVFDNLEFRVNGSVVTLLGQVTRPVLKSDAEGVVKRIEGVEEVKNHIRVLPLSSMDDRIRLAVYSAIYRQPALNQYALGAVPTIHIIVENGHVTLEGMVAREMHKNIANLQANTVSGVFSVTNNLRVDG